MSKSLGSRTALSGSVSRGKNDPSQSLQMIERPLMTPDELKSMPKGEFIVMKTGVHPMKVPLKLFFKWGIKFGEQYVVPDQGSRRVRYASKQELVTAILLVYPPPAPKPVPQDQFISLPPGTSPAVYMYLYDRTDQEGKCFPSIPTIAQHTGLFQSTVRRAIKDLCTTGFLTVSERHRANGADSSNLYLLYHWPP